MNDHDPELSPAGQTRRDEILALALRSVRRRRRTRRTLGAAAAFSFVVGVTALSLQAAYGPAPMERGIARIATAPDSVPRIATLPPPEGGTLSTPRPATWEVLDDQALLLALRSAGRPATLSRSDGRARVVFEDGRE